MLNNRPAGQLTKLTFKTSAELQYLDIVYDIVYEECVLITGASTYTPGSCTRVRIV